MRTEPKAVRLPYSEDNLALLSRPEPPRAAPKPEAPPAPKPEVAAATPPAPAPRPAPEPARPQNENLEDGIEWSWPVNGKLISGFSEGSKGMQFAGRMGDPVHATAAGEVVYVGTGIRGLGKLVVIRHSEKYLSVYGHNRDIVVKEKQKVALGQKIAEVGNSDADQPKLHFEIRRFGKPVDPTQFLPARP
jgi:lipoprotein NlpD